LGVALVLLVVGVLMLPVGVSKTYAADDAIRGVSLQGQASLQAQEADDQEPEANLPYLFAVFIVTWAVLFGFVFVISRRQSVVRHEIEVLRATLAKRKVQETEPGGGVDARQNHEEEGG